MEDKCVVELKMLKRGISLDIEIPTDITARDLLIGLNEAFSLNIDMSDTKKVYLKMESPIALIRGNKHLKEYGIRNGSIINYTE